MRPEWLVVLMPADLEEALAMAGSLLAARTVDLLVVDLPDGRDPAVARARVGDRLGRLAALGSAGGHAARAARAGDARAVARRRGRGGERAPAGAPPEGWIRLGRDVVGRRSEVTVARNRYGPPGRRADLEILYADGGVRDACLRRDGLLDGLAATTVGATAGPEPLAPPGGARRPSGTRHRPRPAGSRATTTDRPPERPPRID